MGNESSSSQTSNAVQRTSARVNEGTGFRPQVPEQTVRCPTCRRLLRPPPGHERFKCPCNQLLTVPNFNSQMSAGGSNLSPSRQIHVKCPRCHTTLSPPPDTEVFRCPCGIPLRLPPSSMPLTNSARMLPIQIRNNNNQNVATTQGAGKAVDDDLLPDDIHAAAQVRKPNEEHWLRNMGRDGKLHWVRLLSNEQEEKIRVLEENCDRDIEKNIESLNAFQIEEKLKGMGIDTSLCILKEDCVKLFLDAKNILKRKKPEELTQLLDNYDADYTNCLNVEDLVQRLLAVGWYGANHFSDGFVRNFVSNFEIEVIPASKYALDVEFKTYKISASEIEVMSGKRFREKVRWFRDKCEKARIKWEDGRVQAKIRRSELLRDSFNNFNRLEPNDLRRYIRFEFIGEEGVDAGGVAREWFELVTDACFNVDCGLFEYSGVDNICYQINPASGIANELHEQYFHFLGRVVGKALFDHKFIRAHVTQPIYKHILGWPITMKDIEFSDARIYQSLVDMQNAEDVSEYLLTFTTMLEVFGEKEEIELKPGGGEIEVTNANLQEYIHLMTKYVVFERTKSQLAHFLRGIYDVIPPVWLSIFDYRELELLLCGLPNINIADWKKNTKYRGAYAAKGEKHKVVQWFWELLEAADQEQRALILQFCTGTSRVPVQGFEALQGNDGNIKPFTIDSAKLTDIVYPKAHTCFNRIELPMYKSKQEMMRRFEEALQQGTTGFSDE